MNSALLVLERKEQILSLLYQDHRLVQVRVHEEQISSENKERREGNDSFLSLGSIYIGKVKNVVPTIDAAFVEVCQKNMGFLPMKHAKNPIIVNRKYDGRIVAGDEILVQVEKEGIKTKDPGLTCNLSFSGKYCVLTTGKPGIGFSSKLDAKTKNFWKQKLEERMAEEPSFLEKTGLVVRTNAATLIDEENVFWEEVNQLLEMKQKVLDSVAYRTCYSCLFQPMEGYLTDIRDTYEASFNKILTNNPVIYERICEVFPTLKHVELYKEDRISLEKLYSVETRLKEALEERVWLKSGAYLVIQQTEALTVIDVNSGKIQKKNPADDIYFQINKEAAEEIALQLKLRNLSGIIIIDFISQNTREQDQALLGYLSSLVKKDPVKTNVIDMTPLGLVEVTRKKISKSLKEQLRKE